MTMGPLDFVWDLTTSSTFFLMWVLLNFIMCMLIPGPSFIILQGLLGAATGFLQAVPLANYWAKITLCSSTPRSVYSIKHSPRTTNWATLFPSMTLLVVITFSYSIIAPVINGFALLTFFLLYMLYKYLFTWVDDHPPSSDTGGLFFPKAIHHVFVGLYVQQICLCTLFFLPLGDSNKPSAIPEGLLMIVLIVFTVGTVDVRTLSIHAYIRPGILPSHHTQFLWSSHQVPASNTCHWRSGSRTEDSYDRSSATTSDIEL